MASDAFEVIVVGAGVFGAWTAEALRAAGKHVLLVDAWGPGHARSSSGGESRMIRAAYGADDIYSRMARDSLPDWKRLSEAAGLAVFHRTGVLYFFQDSEDAYAAATVEAHRRLGLSTERLGAADLAARWPQIAWTGVAQGLYEPGFGVLMSRRGVETLVERFVREGGAYRRAHIRPPAPGRSLDDLHTSDGEALRAEHFVFACGPWLKTMFPELLGDRLFVTRQEVLFFAPPPGDSRFAAPALPAWADFNGGDLYYGFPDLEGRGFKIGVDRHGAPVDPDTEDRRLSDAGLAEVRGYMAARFPALAAAPLSESRICQYENSGNGDFLIDHHPDWENAVLVGMGSGHGFKHGPEVGRAAARLVLGNERPEPRFSLAAKGALKARAVR